MQLSSFTKMIKGKVIIAFLLACAALLLAWGVSQGTFRGMLGTVERYSEPNEKLSIVNKLYRRITLLEQLQRNASLTQPVLLKRFEQESARLQNSLDTLKALYRADDAQVKRIQTMKRLLQRREKLFADYLKLRDSIVSNRVLAGEVNNLNILLLDNSRMADSSKVRTSENRYLTTTIFPTRKESESFLKRLFGNRKKDSGNDIEKIVNEELNVTVDTIISPREDSLIRAVDAALAGLQEKQQRQINRFVTREKQLSEAGHTLIIQMLDVLEQVEREVVKQADANHRQASALVSGSSRRINLIIIGFLFLTAIMLYFILTDISQNTKYRKMLEEAHRETSYHSMAKQRFLSNMSHEIRTPLQAIIGYTEFARQSGKYNPQHIEAIHSSSVHLLQIVNEVLDYSNIISGKFSFNTAVFNLKSLFDEVMSIMDVQASKKSLYLRREYPAIDDECYLNGDPFRLKQILYNLLGNAIKFTRAGGVTLEASCKEHDRYAYLTLHVSDTGIGIERENVEGIFGEFDRGDNALKSSGSGLGLSIVKALAESQGGRVYVQSKAGEGSCFTVSLRFAIAEKPAGQPAPAAGLPRPAFAGTVWMADDDRYILELCSAIFEKHGIAYRCFERAGALLSALDQEEPDCILLDIRMPDMDGAELCRVLRKRLPTGLYIFALTAQALPWEQEEMMKQGFDGLLMKPFREEELVSLVYSTAEESEEPLGPVFNAVQAMAFEPSAAEAVLKAFITDSLADSAQLQNALQQGKPERVSLLLHRLAGRSAQFGAGAVASGFRQAEKRLNDGKALDATLNAQVEESLAALHKLLDLISEKISETAE